MEIDDATNPLIWTARGYVREQDLRQVVEWETHTRLTKPPRWKFWRMGVGYPVFSGITLVIRYYLGDEVVKESRHIYKADGLLADGQTEEIAK